MKFVECRALVKRYGRTRALDQLDLSLEDPSGVEGGGPIALVGPNGAGKTTLFSVLCGFVRPNSGEVRVLGEKPGSSALRGRLSALPQDAAFDPLASVGASLRHFASLQSMDRRASRSEAARVLERVGLEEVTAQQPGALSHGMRKRMALAQALIGTPELVLLDEPTAGVDPPNVRIIHSIVRELARDTRFLISSHNLDELERLTNRVVYLEAGRVSDRGQRAAALADDTRRLGVTLVDIDEDIVRRTFEALPGVGSVRVIAPGEYSLSVDHADPVAAEVLAVCAGHGWRWRSIVHGRSLEQRLYEND